MNETVAELTGAELDARVAEKVFGRKWWLSPTVVINDQLRDVPTWLEEGEDPRNPHGGRVAGEKPPPYSSDLTAAWKVVEKLRMRWWNDRGERHYCFWKFVDGFPAGWVAQIWQRHVHPSHTDEFMGCSQAETLPEAICQVALAWCEENS